MTVIIGDAHAQVVEAPQDVSLPELPPRHQTLLHDPVAAHLDGPDKSTWEAVRRSLRRVGKLIDLPEAEAVRYDRRPEAERRKVVEVLHYPYTRPRGR